MTEFDDDLAEVMADLESQSLGEPALWSTGGVGTPIPCTVMVDELPDAVAVQASGLDDVRVADFTIAVAVIADPKRDDHVTVSTAGSPYEGEWVALGVENRTRTHRVVRCRRAQRDRTGDSNAREIRR